MGKAAVNNSATINITESGRQREGNFSEQVASTTIGPVAVRPGSGGDDVQVTTPPPSPIVSWKAMTTGDEGLKNALYNWINTSKAGVKVTPDVINGREKRLVFNFYGSMGKSIMPGEIGTFEVVFSYSPRAISTTNTIQL